MASVTIKRSHDWDPLSSPTTGCSSKRFRCSNNSMMATSSSPHSKDPTSFGTNSRISSDEISANISDEMKRLNSGRNLSNNPGVLHYSQPLALNLAHAYFGLSPEKCSPNSSTVSVSPSISQSSLLMPSSSDLHSQQPSSPGKGIEDQPILSLKQVAIICNRLLRKQENELKQEYDKILNQKLAEQYETFVNFTHEQIQRRFVSDPTPSCKSSNQLIH